MNNQVKLIDADKLLEWMEERNERSLNIGFGVARITVVEVTDRILRGMFDPDTPPVPTIKPGDKEYRCGACHETSTGDAWDYATRIKFGDPNLTLIEDPDAQHAVFICPKCGEELNYMNLEVVE